MEFDEIKYDYYTNTFNYLKLIMDYLIKKGHSINETFIVRECFNNFSSDMNEEDIKRLVICSSLFEKKLISMPKNEQNMLIDLIYSCYIKGMIINYSNSDYETSKVFYNTMNNKVLEYSGYIGLFGEIENKRRIK